MDKIVEGYMAPFNDWNVGEIKFERLVKTIDAIVESKFTKYSNELTAKIQKLQIEKTFQRYEEEGIIAEAKEEKEKEKEEPFNEKEYEIFKLRQKLDISYKKEKEEPFNEKEHEIFKLRQKLDISYKYELDEVKDTTRYQNDTYTVSIPENFKLYKHILRQKIKKLLNKVNSNVIQGIVIIERRKINNEYKLNVCNILYPTDYAIETLNNKKFLELFKFTLLSTHKEVGSIIPYQQGMAIVQGYGDCPNFMLFNPMTEEFIIFKEMKD